jgi:hypothetical protein
LTRDEGRNRETRNVLIPTATCRRQEGLITLFILSITAYGVELIGLPRTRVDKFNVNIEPGPRMSQPLLAVFSIEGFSIFVSKDRVNLN